MNRLVATLAFGYGLGSIFGIIVWITESFWHGFLVFWIGGAVATIIFALLLKLWVYWNHAAPYRSKIETNGGKNETDGKEKKISG